MAETTFADFATAALPAATALIGASIGWLAARGRERRDMRRAAYVEWLRAARLLVTWPIDEPPPPPSGATVPHPRMLLRLAEAVADVELVGSTEVVRAARVYLDKVYEVGRDLSRKGSYNDVIRGIDEGLKPDRHAVIDLMRRDLKSRR